MGTIRKIAEDPMAVPEIEPPSPGYKLALNSGVLLFFLYNHHILCEAFY